MKKLISLLLSLVLVAALAVPVFAAGSASFSMSASGTTLKRGDTVTLTVSVSCSEPATSYGLSLSYDSSVFELVNGSTSVSGALVNSFNNGFAFMFQSATAYSGTVGTVTFKVKDTASFGSFTISGSASVKNGSATVSASGCSKTITVACNHNYGAWSKVSDTQHGRTCSICQNVEKANHSWNNGTVTKPATCKETGVKTFTCTTCNATKTETIAKTNDHSFGAWTKVSDSQHKHSCSVCGKEETANHTWNSGTVTKPATCKEDGVKTYTCTACNATKTETVAKTNNHSYGSWVKVNDTTHKHTCSVCGKEETGNHSWNSGTVTKPATCKEAGVKTYTCTGCNATKTESISKTNNHSYGNWAKVNDTTHKHTCTVCGKEETGNHSWNSGAVTKPATCKEAGVKTYTCTACNATKTEAIAKLTTHTYDNACDTDCNVCGVTRTTTHQYKTSWSKDKTNHWHECSVCGEKKDVTAHTPGAAATETTAQKCTVCGCVIKAALGHTHKYATKWTTDENGHWYACSGCEEKGSYAAHDFENACDPDCSICGYTRETAHAFGETYKSDGENHWHECAGCGEKKDVAAHESGAAATATTAQTCTICGYEIAPALGGNDETDPTTDVTGDPTEATTPTDATGDPADDNGFPWWIIIVIAVVGVAVAVIVVIKKKKENK